MGEKLCVKTFSLDAAKKFWCNTLYVMLCYAMAMPVRCRAVYMKFYQRHSLTHTHLLIFKGKYALSSLKWSHEYVLPCNGMLCRVMRCGWDALKTGWYFIAWSYFLHCTIFYQTYNVYLGKINVYVFANVPNNTSSSHTHPPSHTDTHLLLWLYQYAMLSHSEMIATMCHLTQED